MPVISGIDHGDCIAHSTDAQLTFRYAIRLQQLGHFAGPGLTQALVVRLGSTAVGVTGDQKGVLEMCQQIVGMLLDDGLVCRRDFILIKAKVKDHLLRQWSYGLCWRLPFGG